MEIVIKYKIRNIRQQQGLSLRELSRKSGVSIAELSEVERNLRDTTITTLFYIAIALDKEPMELLDVFII